MSSFGLRIRRAVAQFGSALDWGSRGRRFKSCQPDHVMSRDIGNIPNPKGSGCCCVCGWYRWLVSMAGVDGEFAENLAGVFADDGDVEALDEGEEGAFIVDWFSL